MVYGKCQIIIIFWSSDICTFQSVQGISEIFWHWYGVWSWFKLVICHIAFSRIKPRCRNTHFEWKCPSVCKNRHNELFWISCCYIRTLIPENQTLYLIVFRNIAIFLLNHLLYRLSIKKWDVCTTDFVDLDKFRNWRTFTFPKKSYHMITAQSIPDYRQRFNEYPIIYC